MLENNSIFLDFKIHYFKDNEVRYNAIYIIIFISLGLETVFAVALLGVQSYGHQPGLTQSDGLGAADRADCSPIIITSQNAIYFYNFTFYIVSIHTRFTLRGMITDIFWCTDTVDTFLYWSSYLMEHATLNMRCVVM